MFAKETKNKKYKNNPYRACNFEIDEEGDIVCPNGEKFNFYVLHASKGMNMVAQRSFINVRTVMVVLCAANVIKANIIVWCESKKN